MRTRARYGIESYTCSNVEEMPDIVRKFVEAKGPVLCDFRTVPDICLPMVAPGKGLDEMCASTADRS